MSTDRKTSNISIIVPVLNEIDHITRLLPDLLRHDVEVIVVDGGSSDNTAAAAKKLRARVITSAPPRSVQMNAGAKAASGDILLFLHADTKLPQDFISHIKNTLRRPKIAAGAFRLAIAGPGFGFRLVERLANFRSRVMQLPYGDQGIFLTAEMFFHVGTFPSLPIMEDFELIRRLKRQGKISILPLAATTSGRRWKKLGIVRTTAINQAVIIGYMLGINPQTLAKWYRKTPRSA